MGEGCLGGGEGGGKVFGGWEFGGKRETRDWLFDELVGGAFRGDSSCTILYIVSRCFCICIRQ